MRAGHEISGVFLLMVVEVFYWNEMYHNYEKKPLRIYEISNLAHKIRFQWPGLLALRQVSIPKRVLFLAGKRNGGSKRHP